MLSRAHIEEYYLPYLSIGSRGSKSKDIIMVVQAILYRLKTGCQWRLLPMRELADLSNYRGLLFITIFANGLLMVHFVVFGLDFYDDLNTA